jgi:hypothetical protein
MKTTLAILALSILTIAQSCKSTKALKTAPVKLFSGVNIAKDTATITIFRNKITYN